MIDLPKLNKTRSLISNFFPLLLRSKKAIIPAFDLNSSKLNS